MYLVSLGPASPYPRFVETRREPRVANDHDRDQIFGLDCRQQSIAIDFWINRPQQT